MITLLVNDYCELAKLKDEIGLFVFGNPARGEKSKAKEKNAGTRRFIDLFKDNRYLCKVILFNSFLNSYRCFLF